MRHLSSDDLLLNRLLTLAWRAAQVGAVIDSTTEPNRYLPEEKRGRFRLARWVSPDHSAGADIAQPGVNLDELERQIRDIERERFFAGGAA